VPARHLAEYLDASAERYPDRPAVVDHEGRALTYCDLRRQADALAAFMISRGVQRGDHVGLVLPKSLPAVVAIFGILKAGAAYVPVDAMAPAERRRRILADCEIRALITDQRSVELISDREVFDRVAATVVVGSMRGSVAGAANLTPWELAIANPTNPTNPTNRGNPEDLAYILYTSGSTGMPKGVMISHQNATAFLDWCSSIYAPTEDDRFSSHPPFYFDPSVLDLFLAIKHGASVYLIPDELGRNAKPLARFIATNRLTIWNSTPSTLMLLLQYGDPGGHDMSALRAVNFGGEVFPVKHLRELKRLWPAPAYYNLYGPTEATTACTIGRIPAVIPPDRDAPYPIGFPGPHCATLVLGGTGEEVPAGQDGLLHVSGPTVSIGYWRRPAENAAAFIERNGVRWYNTGDIVRWDPAEGFTYVGRNDRMVKRRGFRIELDEIESALYKHPKVTGAAVVAVPNPDTGISIVGFVSAQEPTPSIIDMKTFSATKLPAYMIPDRFVFRRELPRTSTDKVDYQTLTKEFRQG
jgi:amino acid adenylation domain-containing protein